MRTQDLQILEERLKKSLAETVIATVNGKIDKLNNQVAAHIEKHEAFDAEVRPILEAYNGGKALGNFAKWMRDVGIAVAAIILTIKNLL